MRDSTGYGIVREPQRHRCGTTYSYTSSSFDRTFVTFSLSFNRFGRSIWDLGTNIFLTNRFSSNIWLMIIIWWRRVTNLRSLPVSKNVTNSAGRTAMSTYQSLFEHPMASLKAINEYRRCEYHLATAWRTNIIRHYSQTDYFSCSNLWATTRCTGGRYLRSDGWL